MTTAIVLLIFGLLNNLSAYPTDKRLLPPNDNHSLREAVEIGESSPVPDDEEEIIFLPINITENQSSTFERVDQDSNDKLTFDEFRQIDLNDDGQITKEEYDRHYEDIDKKAMLNRANYFGKLYTEFDSNFNLLLDETEIAEMLRQRYFVQVRANFDKLFAKFDHNSDGGLDIDEMQYFDKHIPFEEMDALSAIEVNVGYSSNGKKLTKSHAITTDVDDISIVNKKQSSNQMIATDMFA